jgi:cation-transporting ATPase 13A3/4/5
VAAPFTSKTPSIASVITLLREGRCALVTSFSLFKYMALYSMIQFGSVIVLYHVGCVLGDLQFLWADMLLILPLAYGRTSILLIELMLLVGLTEAYGHLTAHKPVTKLISKPVLVSIIGQIIIQLLFLIAIYGFLQLQSW